MCSQERGSKTITVLELRCVAARLVDTISTAANESKPFVALSWGAEYSRICSLFGEVLNKV